MNSGVVCPRGDWSNPKIKEWEEPEFVAKPQTLLTGKSWHGKINT